MAITVKCNCGQLYKLSNELGGKTVRCKNCRQAFLVPASKTTFPQSANQADVSAQVTNPQQSQPIYSDGLAHQQTPFSSPTNSLPSATDPRTTHPTAPGFSGPAPGMQTASTPIYSQSLGQAPHSKPTKRLDHPARTKWLLSLIAVFGVGSVAGVVTLVIQLTSGDSQTTNERTASKNRIDNSIKDKKKERKTTRESNPTDLSRDNTATGSNSSAKTTLTKSVPSSQQPKSPSIVQNGVTYKRLPRMKPLPRALVLKWSKPENKNLNYKFEFSMESGEESQRVYGIHRINVTDKKPEEIMPPSNPKFGVYMRLNMCTVIHPSGLAITTLEAIQHNEVLRAEHNRGMEETKVLAVDEKSQCALLQIPTDNIPAIPLASPDELQIGEKVYLVGDIVRKNNSKETTERIQSATISRIGEDFFILDVKRFDATFGSRGSAIVNEKGNLVGILDGFRENGKIVLRGATIKSINRLLGKREITIPVKSQSAKLGTSEIFQVASNAVMPIYNWGINEIKFVEYEHDYNIDVNGQNLIKDAILKGDQLIDGCGRLLANRTFIEKENRIVDGVESFNMMIVGRVGSTYLRDYQPDKIKFSVPGMFKHTELREVIVADNTTKPQNGLSRVPSAKKSYDYFRKLVYGDSIYDFSRTNQDDVLRSYAVKITGKHAADQTGQHRLDHILTGKMVFDTARGRVVSRDLTGDMSVTENGRLKRYKISYNYSLLDGENKRNP